MSNWVVGYNMPGYLPEMDPWVTSDWEQARDYLISEIERSAEYAFEVGEIGEGVDDDPYDDAIAELKALEPDSEWGDIIGDLSYWLNATDQEPEDEE